ncbi:MAG: rhodanese-like domain-containing protein, partial [Methanomicrobiales archaeon]|nr:rhodanese-like domain-containing protein [Methanomicrobiales archaeon]
GRSAGICNRMREAGFGGVYEIAGGISAWKAAGLPVTGE